MTRSTEDSSQERTDAKKKRNEEASFCIAATAAAAAATVLHHDVSALKHEDNNSSRSHSLASTVVSSFSSQFSFQDSMDVSDTATSGTRRWMERVMATSTITTTPSFLQPRRASSSSSSCQNLAAGLDRKSVCQSEFFYGMMLPILLLSIPAVFWLWCACSTNNRSQHDVVSAIHPNSIFVPGGGFSGIWFTIGRLQSMSRSELASKLIYCYSSGCLTAVAALGGYSKDQVLEMAVQTQRRWQAGQVGLYEVVPDFVDRLVDPNHFEEQDLSIFQNLYIITARKRKTNKDDGLLLQMFDVVFNMMMESDVRQVEPTSSLEHLKEMLLQTTFIPYITGSGFWTLADSRTGDHHMDGAFSFLSHPVCAIRLEFPFHVPHLYTNILNPNLSQDQANTLWRLGVEYGVQQQ